MSASAFPIMYHDVVENGNYAGSGFPGGATDICKIEARVNLTAWVLRELLQVR
jgi:hypothetical protein